MAALPPRPVAVTAAAAMATAGVIEFVFTLLTHGVVYPVSLRAPKGRGNLVVGGLFYCMLS